MIRHNFTLNGVLVCDRVELEPVEVPSTVEVPQGAIEHRGKRVKLHDDQEIEELELVPGDAFCPKCGRVYHQWTETEELRNEARADWAILLHKIARAQRDATPQEVEDLQLMLDALEGHTERMLAERRGDAPAKMGRGL